MSEQEREIQYLKGTIFGLEKMAAFLIWKIGKDEAVDGEFWRDLRSHIRRNAAKTFKKGTHISFNDGFHDVIGEVHSTIESLSNGHD